MQQITLKKMVTDILKSEKGAPLKPSEISLLITERYPDYCKQKAETSKQSGLNLTKQIANQISASIKEWMKKELQIISSEETPRTYWWEVSDTSNEDMLQPTIKSKPISEEISELSLYPLLAEYLLNGMKSRKVYPKRIDEKTASNTKGKNGNKYLHPDMVGLEDLMPQPQWSTEIKEWAFNSGANLAKVWSFEVKLSINSVSEARENYLQALSNSAWSNFGYLVAIKISDKAFNELKTLHELHGIGVILLHVDNPVDDTIVKLPAREKSKIDWGSCNRIAQQNSDFAKFLELLSDFHLTRKIKVSDWYI